MIAEEECSIYKLLNLIFVFRYCIPAVSVFLWTVGLILHSWVNAIETSMLKAKRVCSVTDIGLQLKNWQGFFEFNSSKFQMNLQFTMKLGL